MACTRYSSVEQAAAEILHRTGGRVVLGIPLGLGKPNQLVNALYRQVHANPAYSLAIYTALSLTKPSLAGKKEIERRFIEPFIARVYGDYAELDYVTAARHGELPPNIAVHEFFVQPGAELHNAYAQQHYLSSNYTHAARDINMRGINVLAQLVAEEEGRYSFSCNPEVTLDLLPLLAKRRATGETIITVGQVHHQLPFMGNSALVDETALDIVVDDPACQTTLMSTPNMPVSIAEHFIGLNASALVRDGGTLQIGIGALGDAITAALILRDRDNLGYQSLLGESSLTHRFGDIIRDVGGTDPFSEGLYGCSEMLTYGLFRLFEASIIRRDVLDTRPEINHKVCLHGGFFLGPQAFYEGLRKLSLAERRKIDMTHISFINHLYGDELLKRQHRQHARFINTAFSVSLMGAVISDQLEDGRVLSGVGGQYNFVVQAHELEGARSIILVRATRDTAKGASSNILWNYGHTTVPRHLRDMVVTEYGIADLRGKSDSEVIAAMLNIADSRFQDELLEEAILMKKMPAGYRIPEAFRHNTPERLEALYHSRREQGYFPVFPLGCDFTETEQQLLQALSWLKRHLHMDGMKVLLRYIRFDGAAIKRYWPALERMQLHAPRTFKEKIYQLLVLAALRATTSTQEIQ